MRNDAVIGVVVRHRPADTLAEARLEFEQELRLDPTSANAAYEVAEIHRKSGELERARTFFERAIQHYPDFEEALVGLGRTLVPLGHADLGVARLRDALALNPANEVAWYQIAQAYKARGEALAQEKALAEYQRIRATKNQALRSAGK